MYISPVRVDDADAERDDEADDEEDDSDGEGGFRLRRESSRVWSSCEKWRERHSGRFELLWERELELSLRRVRLRDVEWERWRLDFFACEYGVISSSQC